MSPIMYFLLILGSGILGLIFKRNIFNVMFCLCQIFLGVIGIIYMHFFIGENMLLILSFLFIFLLVFILFFIVLITLLLKKRSTVLVDELREMGG